MAAEIVPMVMCKSNEHCVVQVPSSDGSKKYTCTFGPTPGGEYAYGWECSCKSFEFRKTCKHIAEAEEKRCGWHQQFDGGEAKNGKCPECGGDIVGVRVAV